MQKALTPPAVSVVMGTYNGRRFIESQLVSIIEQTCPPAEIIISDDGSTDCTPDIIMAISKTCPIPIKLTINRSNLGFGLNFITASAQSSYPIIAFCDQDDVWYPNKLRQCTLPFSDPATSLVTHRADLINTAGRKIGSFNQYITRNRYISPMSGDPWGGYFGFSMVFRKSLLDLIDYPTCVNYLEQIADKAHDRLIYFLASVSGQICEIDESLTGYRQHSTNVFGAGVKEPIRVGSERLRISDARIQAAQGMIDLLAHAPDEIDSLPLYNKAEATLWWSRVLLSEKGRNRFYSTDGFYRSLRRWALNIRSNVYQDNAKACMKDLFFLLNKTLTWNKSDHDLITSTDLSQPYDPGRSDRPDLPL